MNYQSTSGQVTSPSSKWKEKKKNSEAQKYKYEPKMIKSLNIKPVAV